MTDRDKSQLPMSGEWSGLRELDQAMADNRLTAYTWKKAWADPWERRGLIAAGLIGLAFIGYVVIYDGLL